MLDRLLVTATTLTVMGLGAAGCSFNESGVQNDATGVQVDADAGAVDDLTADAPMDAEVDSTPADAGAEAAPDSGPAALCPDGGSSDAGTPVCRSDEDEFGESGVCIAGQFKRTRYCFDDARCLAAQGVCAVGAGACVACQNDNDCSGLCTMAFDPTLGYKLCCVDGSSNAGGDYEDSCTQGSDCASGLCTLDGHCFTPCVNSGDCNDSAHRCELVSFLIAGLGQSKVGCVLP